MQLTHKINKGEITITLQANVILTDGMSYSLVKKCFNVDGIFLSFEYLGLYIIKLSSSLSLGPLIA